MRKIGVSIALFCFLFLFQYVFADTVCTPIEETGTMNICTYTDDNGIFHIRKADETKNATITKDVLRSFSNNINITVDHVIKVSGNLDNLFSGYGGNLQDVDFSKLDVADVTDLSGMFRECWNLTSVNLSGWNILNVTNISYIFASCHKLSSLNITGWDTSNVSDMQCSFAGCESLKYLDLNSLNTSKVTNFSQMFYMCSSLKTLLLSNWNTSNATNMQEMFGWCNSLQSLDISDWNISNVSNMYGMFEVCSSLKNLDISSWKTPNLSYMGAMFSGCSSLKALDLNNWNTSNVTDLYSVFNSCNSLESLMIKDWDVSKVTNLQGTFLGCSSLKELDISRWNTVNVTDMNSTFANCSSLKKLDLSGWKTPVTYQMSNMFSNCKALNSLNLENFNTYNVTEITNIFSGCNVLSSLTLGEKTITRNIFTNLPNYNSSWFYVDQGASAGNPINLGSVRNNGELFTGYDANSMAGTWTALTLKAQNYNGIFDGNMHEVGATSSDSDAIITYSLDGGQTWTENKPNITNVGKVTYKAKAQKGKYVIAFADAALIVNPLNITVTIKGKNSTVLYNHKEHSVSGYDASFSSNLYKNEYYEYSGTASAVRTEPGKTMMGLSAAQFLNKSANFNVNFNVTDGFIEILPLTDVKVFIFGNNNTVAYDGKEHHISGYEYLCNNDLYTDNDFELSGTASAVRTDVGKSMMGLTVDSFINKNPNFNPTFIITDGFQEILPPDNNLMKVRFVGNNLPVNSNSLGINNLSFIFNGTAEFKSIGMETTPKGLTGNDSEKGTAENIILFEISDGSLTINQSDQPVVFPQNSLFPTFFTELDLPSTGFSSYAGKQFLEQPMNIAYKNLPMSIQIPSLNIYADLVSVPLEGSSWPVEWLGDRAGLLEGSADPGKGYSIIAAHNTLNNTNAGPFSLLSLVNINDMIFINSSDLGFLNYTVYANKLLKPDGFKEIASIAEQEPGSLILVTCENESVEGGYLNRRVVFAKPKF